MFNHTRRVTFNIDPREGIEKEGTHHWPTGEEVTHRSYRPDKKEGYFPHATTYEREKRDRHILLERGLARGVARVRVA